jgi:phage protein D
MSLGIYLSLLIGKTVPEPAPPAIIEALQSAEVTTSDQGRDGFQLSFSLDRTGAPDADEYPLLSNPLIKAFNRVVIMVAFGVVPKVLIDGIITHHQVSLSSEPGKSTLSITGEDLSVMMGLKDKQEEHTDQSAPAIVSKIIGAYSKYDLKAKVVSPASAEQPSKIDSIPHQNSSDLRYIQRLAGLYKYVFYVEPESPKQNIAYWGPPDRKGKPQQTLSVNMGEATNVNAINFQMNSLSQSSLKGKIQDPKTGEKVEVPSEQLDADSPFAAQSVDDQELYNKITKFLRDSGVSTQEALTKAQTEAKRSADALTVNGELDSIRYGDVLRARQPVTLRGVGQAHNGLYYVKKVTHSISKGTYKQSFTLSREGLGTTVTKVDKKT